MTFIDRMRRWKPSNPAKAKITGQEQTHCEYATVRPNRKPQIQRLISTNCRPGHALAVGLLSRIFEVCRGLVWKAWTEADHAQWWGPNALTIHASKKMGLGAGIPRPFNS